MELGKDSWRGTKREAAAVAEGEKIAAAAET